MDQMQDEEIKPVKPFKNTLPSKSSIKNLRVSSRSSLGVIRGDLSDMSPEIKSESSGRLDRLNKEMIDIEQKL